MHVTKRKCSEKKIKFTLPHLSPILCPGTKTRRHVYMLVKKAAAYYMSLINYALSTK